ncbi:hypothetical protein MtrunA17_Chr1g0201961 [Medicago truncatula]|uniref:Uncharacterized protein n=1 Tax=Medicago truncatula TaxID=3880 RepID=G7J137_MEDTR|nr:hypothetical protein MTR_1g098930 [Medicago truncatula]RHN81697.1 hypothetical protein MtrunA17_Chr1g0201961 [Medicago truncatula]
MYTKKPKLTTKFKSKDRNYVCIFQTTIASSDTYKPNNSPNYVPITLINYTNTRANRPSKIRGKKSTILSGQTRRRIDNSELGFGKSKLGTINNSKLRFGI